MKFLQNIKHQQALIYMTLPFLLHLIIFRYVPLVGWIMAFQDFTISNINESWFSQKLIGFRHFAELFRDALFRQVIVNTLAMSFIKLIMGTLSAILVAVLINETKNKPFKKSVQVISYLPHFVSWVVAANIFLELLSPRGIVNEVLVGLHLIKEPVLWMGKPKLFYWIIGFSHVWKTAGFGAIIYLAAMTAIDPQLYEAADMDGAGRLRRIFNITLPCIRPTIVILLIMNIGQLLEAGFEQQFLLRNPIVKKYSDVLTIYILEYGIRMTRYSFATAAGIFKSVVSLVLVLSANFVAKKLGEETLM
ncbi:MAG: sugar ABC transporter permease [Spirochaetales bacterium]|nr:sugar ABC transporter permease [Spirochaetales bacterium]